MLFSNMVTEKTMPEKNRVQLSSGKKVGFTIVVLLFLSVFLCMGLIVARSFSLYRFVKSNEHGFEGRIFRYDPELGHAPVPDSRGAQIFPIGPPVSIRFDHYGFRQAMDDPDLPVLKPPMVLALGCSYTFGAACPAEKTFTCLTAQALNGTPLNAGIPGYGLGQMLILAKRLIPKFKPDLVLVQYSPWLVDRGTNPFAPSWVGALPSPFFSDGPDRSIKINPPVFRTKSFDPDIQKFRSTPRSVLDFMAFLTGVGIPLYSHDGLHMGGYYAGRMTGRIPHPCRSPERVVEYVYTEIYRLCQENNSRMVIVVLTEPGSSRKPSSNELSRLQGLGIVVNAQSALFARLPDKSLDAYDRAYHHHRGENAVLVDRHPNENAHRIIAEEIIKAVR
jgi:hypothetical protein